MARRVIRPGRWGVLRDLSHAHTGAYTQLVRVQCQSGQGCVEGMSMHLHVPIPGILPGLENHKAPCQTGTMQYQPSIRRPYVLVKVSSTLPLQEATEGLRLGMELY